MADMNENGLLIAARRLADNVRDIAQESFGTIGGNFDDDFRAEDPCGYAAWKALVDILNKEEGHRK